MKTDIESKAKVVEPFPAQAVEALLRQELLRVLTWELEVRGQDMPSTPQEAMSYPVEIDSMVPVGLLCAIEPIVNIKLAEGIVKAGGYSSIDAAVAHMLPRIEAIWNKKATPK